MKIRDVKAVYPNNNNIQKSWRTNFWQIVVRVETDTGAIGFGYGGGGTAAVQIINGHFNELLVGKSIETTTDIESLWKMMYKASIPYGRKGLAIMALSGVDLAFYDLVSKNNNKPVYDLIGGLKNQKIKSYVTGEHPELYRDMGYTAHKFTHNWDGTLESYDIAVSKAYKNRLLFGADATLMIDTYMSWDERVTIEMSKRLGEFNLLWFEDILTPDHLEEQSKLIPTIAPIKIAGGEHEFTQHGFLLIAKTNALNIWQPDVTWCGGITAGLKIVKMANAIGIPVSPHRGGETWGLQLMAATDCMDLAEIHNDIIGNSKNGLWERQPQPKDGFIYPNDDPGFGVTLNQEILS